MIIIIISYLKLYKLKKKRLLTLALNSPTNVDMPINPSKFEITWNNFTTIPQNLFELCLQFVLQFKLTFTYWCKNR